MRSEITHDSLWLENLQKKIKTKQCRIFVSRDGGAYIQQYPHLREYLEEKIFNFFPNKKPLVPSKHKWNLSYWGIDTESIFIVSSNINAGKLWMSNYDRWYPIKKPKIGFYMILKTDAFEKIGELSLKLKELSNERVLNKLKIQEIVNSYDEIKKLQNVEEQFSYRFEGTLLDEFHFSDLGYHGYNKNKMREYVSRLNSGDLPFALIHAGEKWFDDDKISLSEEAMSRLKSNGLLYTRKCPKSMFLIPIYSRKGLEEISLDLISEETGISHFVKGIIINDKGVRGYMRCSHGEHIFWDGSLA